MVQKILVLQTAFLGDMLLSIPLLNHLRKLYPRGEIILFCRKGFGQLFLKTQLVDRVSEIDKGNFEDWWKIKKKLREEKYDLVVSPHRSFRTALLVFSLSAEKKIGFSSFLSSLVFDESVERPVHFPDGLRQLFLLTPVDPELAINFEKINKKFQVDSPLASPRDHISIPLWAKMEISYPFLDPPDTKYSVGGMTKSLREIMNEKRAFLAPGSQWPTKRWAAQGFVEVGQKLMDQGFATYLVGSEEDLAVTNEVHKGIPKAINIAGQTSLVELLFLFKGAEILISNDSGLMHLGSIVQVPTIAIFGPTTLSLGYRPWQDKALVVEKTGLSCRPCGKHGHLKCPLGTHECMKALKSSEVMHSVQQLLSN